MTVWINEQPRELPVGTRLFAVRDLCKPEADVLIVNGFPATSDQPLRDQDRVVLIRRGERPSAGELEALMAARHTPGVHERVKGASVGIAGAGGLGSAVAVALARIGVGRLIIADFDVVEPSNLNRQQYFVDQIGLPKVEALRDNLARINPYVKVDIFNGRLTPENIPTVFAEARILVEAFDAAAQKAMLVESFRRHFPERPLVAASGLAGYQPSNTVVTRRVGAQLVLVGDGQSAARPGEGLMAPRVGIAAHHQANAVLRLLLGEEPQ
ncbi:sulfur carrier protein ThiS adenylyltransferase ThiF [Geoalkalibacter sp.]|uniref:sulfur carrier protein ThiS adenylyltransferase ThiF n=1 Tax=Geoalkalibacter sp. TaxID=3041440 RepID=UPI00272DDCA0|nr:sulfur carrier protein ThiS adenylyltransferase ThiF [Geoalkalibacter sp.]